MVTEAISPTATKALNLRDIPLPIYTQLKVFAAASNMGIREYCISIFEAHIQQQAQSSGGNIMLVMTPANCSELILSAARLDYIADYDLD